MLNSLQLLGFGQQISKSRSVKYISRAVFRTKSNIYDGVNFCKNSLRVKPVNYFPKKAPQQQMSDWIPNTPLISLSLAFFFCFCKPSLKLEIGDVAASLVSGKLFQQQESNIGVFEILPLSGSVTVTFIRVRSKIRKPWKPRK